jgi:hypothetical protein
MHAMQAAVDDNITWLLRKREQDPYRLVILESVIPCLFPARNLGTLGALNILPRFYKCFRDFVPRMLYENNPFGQRKQAPTFRVDK